MYVFGLYPAKGGNDMKAFVTLMAMVVSCSVLVITGGAFAEQLPTPNQDNVSKRADETFKNPKDAKIKKRAASKRAQLRKERDAKRTVKVVKDSVNK